ncbi:MAG: hypothetical protein D6820_14135, partial [Lentisphaerae bacterium]
MTQLRFAAGQTGVAIALLALMLGFACAWLYRQQLQGRHPFLRWLLPILRGGTVAVLLLLLAMPEAVWREQEGEPGHVCFVVDASRSMAMTDRNMSPGRKLLSLWVRGKVPSNMIDHDMVRTILNLRLAASEIANRWRIRKNWHDLSASAMQLRRSMEDALTYIRRLNSLPRKTGLLDMEKGYVFQEVWFGVPGNKINDFKRSAKSRKKPDKLFKITSLSSVRNIADSYASRVRGYLVPPEEGDYVFLVYGDDETVFKLQLPQKQKAKLQTIASVPEFTGLEEWNRFDSQRSKSIHLKKDKPVYFELWHKEGGGSDYFGVGWILPDGSREFPIPAARLHTPDVIGNTTSPAEVYELGMNILHRFDKLHKSASTTQKNWNVLQEMLRWATRLQHILEAGIEEKALQIKRSGQPTILDAFRQFDRESRWTRLSEYLMNKRFPIMKKALQHNQVELYLLRENKVSLVRRWLGSDSIDPGSLLQSLPPPTGSYTNLKPAFTNDLLAGKRGTIILFSDGQHNRGELPLKDVTLLGRRGVQVHTVCFGAHKPVFDLAIRNVSMPYIIRGLTDLETQWELADTMPPGKKVTLRVDANGIELARKVIHTSGEGKRRIHWKIPIQPELLRNQLDRSSQRSRDRNIIAITMNFAVTRLPDDRQPANN